ncbi:MAG: hypothetical protein F6K00_05395 [Leptolyngbya sp. SIOISBB]|nr:hypothetical protein [Leptolyngbya sp. SIOISBB]
MYSVVSPGETEGQAAAWLHHWENVLLTGQFSQVVQNIAGEVRVIWALIVKSTM